MSEFKEAELPGCIRSTDCTYIVTRRCKYNLKNNHLGPKSSHPTRTFNLTCNHRIRILHSMMSGPGRWSDQTMVRLDRLISGIQDSTILEDLEFELLAYDKEDEVIVVKYQGVYIIVDNGYLAWSCTVPSFTVTSNTDNIWWSKWIELMRKDVECTFGILIGQWRILKTGVWIYGVDNDDKIWSTCCALHNWLLNVDGLTD